MCNTSCLRSEKSSSTTINNSPQFESVLHLLVAANVKPYQPKIGSNLSKLDALKFQPLSHQDLKAWSLLIRPRSVVLVEVNLVPPLKSGVFFRTNDSTRGLEIYMHCGTGPCVMDPLEVWLRVTWKSEVPMSVRCAANSEFYQHILVDEGRIPEAKINSALQVHCAIKFQLVLRQMSDISTSSFVSLAKKRYTLAVTMWL